MQRGNKLIFLKPVSLSATVGLSTRPSKGAAANDSSPPVKVEDAKKKTGQGIICIYLSNNIFNKI